MNYIYYFLLSLLSALLFLVWILYFRNYPKNNLKNIINTIREQSSNIAREAQNEVSAEMVQGSPKFFPRINNENADQYFYHSRDLIYRFRVTPTPGWEYLTPSVYDITGFTREEHYNNSSIVFNTIHPEDRQILIDKISNRVDYSKPIIQRWYRKNGSIAWLEEYCSPIYDSKGFLVAFEGVCRDITERVEQDSARKDSIINDSLTGLLNREYLEHILSKTGEDEPIGIIVVGIDGLRGVNYSSGGYEAGNRMIITLGNILKGFYIENSLLARTGPGEFAILLKELPRYNPESVSRSILKAILDSNSQHPDLILHISIGYSSTSALCPRPIDVLLEADKNMYSNRLNKVNKK